MNRMEHSWKNGFKKPLTVFVGSRYVVYILQFVRGISIAVILGPSLFGIWGFIMLIQAYLMNGTLGVEFALNVILSTGKSEEKNRIDDFISMSFFIITLVSAIVLVLCTYLQIFHIDLFPEYQFSHYVLLLGLFVIASFYQQIFVNIYRFHGLLREIVYVDLLTVTLTIIPIFFFPSGTLITAILVSFIATAILGNIFYGVIGPYHFNFKLKKSSLFSLLSLAIPLLIYNLSSNLMTILARTVVSAYYSIESMGFYTFAFNISNSIFLGLSAISWAIFPTLLSGMKEGLEDNEVITLIRKTNNLYGNAAFFVVIIAIVMSPFLLLFFHKYRPILGLLGVLLISQGIGAIGLGYGSLVYSRKKIVLMTLINMIAVTIGISLAFFAASSGYKYTFIALAVLVGQIVQLLIFVWASTKLIKFNSPYWMLLKELFTIGRMLAVACVVTGVIVGNPLIWNITGTIFYLLFDHKQLMEFFHYTFNYLRT